MHNDRKDKKCGVTHMVKLEMNADGVKSTSKAASLVMWSWFHTVLSTVVKA